MFLTGILATIGAARPLIEARAEVQAAKIRAGDDGLPVEELASAIVLMPAVAAFVPGGADLMQLGFTALQGYPPWYLAAASGAMSVLAGKRGLVKIKPPPK